MKLLLEEQRVNTKEMNAAKMWEELNKFEDFKNSVAILEQHIESLQRRSHM